MKNHKSSLSIKLPSDKYIVAVSGGIDSVVLLDMLSKQPQLELVVAYFDHGIRDNSNDDRQFVHELAEKHGYKFEYAEGNLGKQASEEIARKARYAFLLSVKAKHSATAIITAHHQDDVIETAIINLMRGTHNTGLSSLKSRKGIVRPLLTTSKQQIKKYARIHGLKWREDTTNNDQRYLRNYIRLSVIPALHRKDSKWRARLINKINRSAEISRDVNSAISRLADDNFLIEDNAIVIQKNWLIMLPNVVGMEIIKHAILRLDADIAISKTLLKSCLLFAKTAINGRRRTISKGVDLVVGNRQIRFSRNTGA